MACLTSCEDVGAAGAVTSPVGSSEVKRISEREDRGGRHDRQDTWSTTAVTDDITDRTTASPDLAVQEGLWGSGQDWESYLSGLSS